MIERYWIYDDYRECPGTGELFVVLYSMIWSNDTETTIITVSAWHWELFVVLYSMIWSKDTETTIITVSALALGVVCSVI